MDKYLSIITNFGCHYTCPYCIVKRNGLQIPETTMHSLDHLDDILIKGKYNIVSVSGGGDPLYEYGYHTDYYTVLFRKLNKLNIPMEMHTSYVNNSFPTYKCSRVVYHLRHTNQLSEVKRKGNEIVRVVYVVDNNMSKEEIEWISGYVNNSNNIDELSFRQMVDGNYETTYYNYDLLKWGHDKGLWHYIDKMITIHITQKVKYMRNIQK